MNNKNEETKDNVFKKYWFVMLVSVLLVVFIGFYIKDYVEQLPVTVEEKTVDGKKVIYDIDGEYYFAEDLYDDLYASSGVTLEYNRFMAAVLDACYETTSDMQTTASNMASYYISYYGEDELVSSLESMGYYNGIEDLTVYYLTYLKNLEMLKEYYNAHYDEYVPDYIEESGQKAIYHILVSVADVTETTDDDGNTIHTANPTEEEQAKLDEVLKALETEDFETVAKEYSDDSSASEGGFVAVCDDDTAAETYVTEFADAVAELGYDEQSEVVTSTYGYHIIKVKEPTQEQCMEDSTFIQNLNSNYDSHYTAILMEKANEANFVIYDEKLQNQIDNELEAESEEE